MTVWLRILACSDLPVAEYHRGTAALDVDLVVDRDGLPYLPRWRIHRILSESWRERLARPFADLQPVADRVLGARGTLQAGIPAIHDARLHPDLLAWLRWATQRPNDPVPIADVVDSLSVVRTSTARDRTRGGAPLAQALRDARLLVAGTELWAPVESSATIDDEAVARFVFAAACIEIRAMGLGRNRGAGLVRLSIHCDQGGTPGDDLTGDWYRPEVIGAAQ